MAGISDDELSAAMKACAPHRRTDLGPLGAGARNPYEPPWEHCWTIEREFNDRKAKRDEVDEAKNADLKMSRTLAERLKSS